MRPGTVIAERYRLERRVSVGATGEVWAARHEHLDARVAVKLLHRSLVDHEASRVRFRREAKAMARIRSEHVVEVLDLGEVAGRPYLVMELLDGTDLESWSRRFGPAPLDLAARIAAGIGRGLRQTHALGLVHRDLKPANIFLAGDVVKILDFGLTKETGPMRIETGAPTVRGELLGSPRYMSPEQVRGWDVDERSDLWSFAAVLYLLLVGRPAFDGRSVTDVMLSIWSRSPPPPSVHRPELGEGIDAFFRRAFAKDRERRWPDAETFVHAFVEALTASTTTTVRASSAA